MIVCKNCATAYTGDFCYHCGQAAATDRITVRQILTDTFFSVVKVNRGFLFTVKELSLRPGAAIEAYVAGKRLLYYAPHKYLFLIGTIATFLTARYRPFSGEYASGMIFNGGINAFFREFLQYADAYTTVINIITIPVFALFSWLLFRAHAFNYAENLVLNAYITSQQLLLFILLVPALEVMPAAKTWLLPGYTLLTVVYNGWVYVAFFRSQKIKIRNGIVRAAVAMLLAYLGQLLFNLLVFYGQRQWL